MKPAHFLVSVLICVPAWAQNPVMVHVVDTQKAPVPQAEVEARVFDGKKVVTRPGKTDAQGDVTLDLPTPPEEKKPVNVWVVAKGFGFAQSLLKGAKTEVALEKGAVWRAKVVDSDGHPIEGATVTVGGARAKEGDGLIYIGSTRFAKNFKAVTGADGSFEIPDVPMMKLIYAVSAPGFAQFNGQDVLPDNSQNLSLEVGGGLKGRVLGLDGKPLPKVHVYAVAKGIGGDTSGAVSGEDGTYEINTLAAGSYAVYVDLPEGTNYLIPSQENASVEKTKINTVPDLQASPGVEVQGIVRDAVTRKGLAGAGVSVESQIPGAGMTSPVTGEDGKFSLRVLPGHYRLYLYALPDGYVRPMGQAGVDVGKDAPEPLTFDLQATVPLQGLVTDEAGKPLAATIITGYDSSFQSDAAGKWQLKPQGLPVLPLAGGDGEDGYLEVVTPHTIDVTKPSKTTIVVRQKPWQSLSGRVLNSDGTPLAGAHVTVNFFTSQGDDGGLSSWTRTATSNENGDYVLPKIRAAGDAQFLTVTGEKGGYAFKKGGEIGKNGPVWKVSDLIFSAMNRRVAGETTAGARVVAAGQEAVADATGHFLFEGLPADETLIYAAKDGLFGGGAVTEPLKIELQAQGLQGTDAALAHEIWSEVAKDMAGKNFYAGTWVTNQLKMGGDNFESQVEAARNDDMALISLSTKWAGKVDLPTLEKALVLIKNPDMRVYAYLCAAGKANDAALAKEAIQEAEAAFATPEKDVWWREMNLYREAAVVTKFNNEKTGFAALDRAIVFTLKNHPGKSLYKDGNQTETGHDEMFAMQTAVVAEGSLALMQRLFDEIEVGEGYDIQALDSAIPVVARKYGVNAALPLLDQLEKLPEPDANVQMRRADHTPQYAFSEAVSKVVPLMGKTPDQALGLAKRSHDPSLSVTALAAAARFLPAPDAANLWREVVARSSSEQAPRYAAAAWKVDPQLGRELFSRARDRAEADSKQEWQGRGAWANYAFYYAQVDAAEARLILEKEWGVAMQKKSDNSPLGSIARAMTAIDGQRAWEMARSIPNELDSLEARRKVGQYLAADAEKRKDWSFERWGRGDTWDGDEE